MLSLDLFATRFEKELHEGAVDKLEQRLIDNLNAEMQDLLQRARDTKDMQHKKSLQNQFEKIKAKRDEIFKIRTEQQVPSKQDAFAYVKPEPKGIGDIQDPKTKMAQLAQKAKQGPLANVGAGLKGFLTGKEEPLDEQQPTLSKRGQGIQNMKNLEVALDNDYAEVILQFQGGVRLVANAEGMDVLADYYNGMDSAGRTNFVYNVLGDQARFTVLCRQLGVDLTPMPVQQMELPLNEKRSQKKKFKSTIAQRELEKAVAAEPAAGSPIEAFILRSIENDQAQSRQLQDLETEIQTLKSRPTPAPAQPSIAPVAAKPAPTPGAPAVAPSVAKPTVTSVPEPTIAGPAEVPQPVPTVQDLPKKDQKILQKVKGIEKRLQDRIDQYQTAQTQQDTTSKLDALQQQINDLKAQKQTATDKLSDQGKEVSGVLDRSGGELIDFSQALARKQSRQQEPVRVELPARSVVGSDLPPGLGRRGLKEAKMKRALDDYKLATDTEFYKTYKMTKRDFYNTVVNPSTKKFQAPKACPQCGKNYESCVCESVKETFAMPGTTIPRKSLIQGYTVYWNPTTQMVSVTRGGTSEEAAIEQARVGTPSLKNFRQAADRLIDRIESDLNEAKEIHTREDFIRERDRLLRMISQETNPANKQILKSAIRQLENRAENEGWISMQHRMVREESSTSSEEAESAILKRIMVAHLDLLKEYGPQKVMQAVEEVAYNVGDLPEIGSSDVSGWVEQVKQILGVPEELDEKWSAKYKRSINCANPKGFSQRAHCQGRKKK